MNSPGPTTERIPWHLVGLGCGLVLVVLAEIVWMVAAGSALVRHPGYVVGVLSSVPFAIVTTWGGYWLHRSDLDPSRYGRVMGWCFGGILVFTTINVAQIVFRPDLIWPVVFTWIRWAVSLGAGVGVLIGIIEGRSIERALAAERAALENEYLESQRDLLDYLNSILRHEVLNAATVINGYASNLLEEKDDLDEESRGWIEIVVSQSADMTDVIEDVRVLLHATDGEVHFSQVELAGMLDHEVRKLHHTFGTVDVELSAPDTVYVRADDLLRRVFANLFANAVEHNDAETPRVSITVASDPDAVRIEVADNGPGIPDRKRDQLFERIESRGSTHGLGLYLVAQLVDRYGGSVELTETGPDGSLFTVELPRADATTVDRSDEETAVPTSLSAG